MSDVLDTGYWLGHPAAVDHLAVFSNSTTATKVTVQVWGDMVPGTTSNVVPVICLRRSIRALPIACFGLPSLCVNQAASGSPPTPGGTPLTETSKKFALVAHDARKPVMVEWVGRNLDIFRQLDLVATGTTGKVLLDHFPELRLERLESGPRGGDQQVGALIVADVIDVLFFFIDPLTPMPHDVDVKALLRLSILYDVPCACSIRSADIILDSVRKARAAASGDTPRSV